MGTLKRPRCSECGTSIQLGHPYATVPREPKATRDDPFGLWPERPGHYADYICMTCSRKRGLDAY